ncbi:metal ABC transporter substrate-binding protein [Haloimpatiens lingqiaonensis]|uniref:metal ABC transporter substrate-binding protein n=1 Tax=Haloimpatiens lingqiaonensis TaxID=1380675 RepID=UPI0010FDC597|nr:metal ABC transporter substrate-binding protein [Haloimpatiens lingqiaonensis]
MKKNTFKIFSLIIIACLALLAGCSNKPKEKQGKRDENKISVYTSFYAMYDLTKKIGGDKVNITNIVPAGIEPHDWEPKPSNIAELEEADVIVYNGAGMEGWIDKVLKTLKNKDLIAVETSKEIKLLDNAHGDEHLKHDPHVWLNPMNAKKQMEAIKDALVKADPSNKSYYEKNYEDNARKMDQLDKKYKEAVGKFTQKNMVVSHEAFGYLCDAYGLKQVGIEGLNAESEPSPARMAEIVNYVKENNVKYIFSEELLSPKVAEAISKETGTKIAILNPLEGIKDEDMNAGKEYFSIMNDNLEILKKALQ